jgi:hypothetical protein
MACCRVLGLEHVPELVAYAQERLAQLPWARPLLEGGQLQILQVSQIDQVPVPVC